MKKFAIGSLMVALSATSAMFAANQSIHIGSKSHVMTPDNQVITLSELTKEMVEDFFAGKTSRFILECPQGAVLPFSLSLQGEFLSLSSDELPRTVKVLKTCYIKCVDETFFFSADLQIWKDFHEFFTGMMGVSLNVNERTPTVGLNIELNQRT